MKNLSAAQKRKVKECLADLYPTYHKDGSITVRASFYYASRSGINALIVRANERLTKAGYTAVLLESDEQWKSFRGDDNTAKGQGSFYWAKFNNFCEIVTTEIV